jgi:hypothetical protein
MSGRQATAPSLNRTTLKTASLLNQALAQADQQSADLAAAAEGDACDQVVVLSTSDFILSPLSFD